MDPQSGSIVMPGDAEKVITVGAIDDVGAILRRIISRTNQ